MLKLDFDFVSFLWMFRMTAAENGQLIVLSAITLGWLLEERLAYYTHIYYTGI